MRPAKLFEIVKKNLRRAPYQALIASMVMFLTFLALTVFLLLTVLSQKILLHYESKPQAIAFFKDNTPQTDVQIIENALRQTGKVVSTKFVSKEEALNIYKERNKDKPALLELVTANILPSSLEISTVSPQDLEPITEILKKEPVIDEVVYPKDVVQSLTNFTTAIRWIGGIAVTFLIIFSTLIILTIIGFKLRLKRKEIETMRLLGASSWFIRFPYILEGILYGVIGALLAWSTLYAIIWYFTPVLIRSITEPVIFPISPMLMLTLLGIEFLVALLIGGLGAFSAVRRYLKI